jgi:hypothetical protein
VATNSLRILLQVVDGGAENLPLHHACSRFILPRKDVSASEQQNPLGFAPLSDAGSICLWHDCDARLAGSKWEGGGPGRYTAANSDPANQHVITTDRQTAADPDPDSDT